MNEKTIAFIGGGNMAASLIGGLISDGYQARKIGVSDPDQAKLNHLKAQYGISISSNNDDLIAQADIVVLAVKPQMMKAVITQFDSAIQIKDPLIISIAAGIREIDILQWLGNPQMALVRTMPNTPATVQCGATALHASPNVSAEQKELAESVMRAVGMTLWVDQEKDLDAVTALSGSGPAYFFLFMEAMEKSASKLGLDPDTARLLTLQTAFGAAKMALECPEDTHTLRTNVTSPGGTTEQAINTLQAGGLEALIDDALKAAYTRSFELSEILGENRNG